MPASEYSRNLTPTHATRAAGVYVRTPGVDASSAAEGIVASHFLIAVVGECA